MPHRLVSLPVVAMALPLWLITVPLWLPVVLVVDTVGRYWRYPTARLGFGLGVYLVHEWLGTLAAGWLWLRGGFGHHLDLDAHRALQGWWATSLLRWARRLFGVRIDPSGLDALPRSTFILLSRHASMADAVMPAALVAGSMGRFIHYVMKRELRWVPAIDLVGGRLGNHFVARVGETEAEAEAIEDLARFAKPNSVLVIFPEGTYATPRSRRRVLESLRRHGEHEAAARAETLKHLLPPRPAGTLAMLRGRPEADVVILGHVGLEGAAELKDLRRRIPLSDPIQLRWWVHPRSELPATDEDLASWLTDRWADLDRWLVSASGRQPSP